MFSSDIVPLFVIKGLNIFQNVFLVAKFLFLAMYSKYVFLVFPVSVLHLFFPVSKARKFSRQGHLRYLFLSLDLFMITLPNSLLMKGAWLPLTCFDFKWVCLCGIS